MKALAVIVFSIWTALASALIAHAQSITTIHSFTGTDGSNPSAGLTLGPDGNFYGTTELGGSNSYGTVFQLTTYGNLTTLVSFSGHNGVYPCASLTLGPDGNFYGTTSGGGSNNYGTVFEVTTNGRLTTLANFNDTNGANPHAGLTLGPDGNFYGTTCYGPTYNGNGTVFQVKTNGTLTTLAYFNGTNGSNPQAGLTLGPDGNFYGTTQHGGSNGGGTIFELTTKGTLTTLVNFNGYNGDNSYAGLTLGPDGNFYGITSTGGTYDAGNIFQMTTNGTLTTLANFNGTNGSYPEADLTLGPDGSFYGAALYGGSSFIPGPYPVLPPDTGYGTVFNVTTNGILTTLVNFNNTNGADPFTSLTLGPDGNFYGTLSGGGGSDNGIVFMVAPLSGPFFNGEVSLGSKWYYLETPSNNVFGYYSMAYFPYVYHNNMGFEYYIDANDPANGAYFYDFTSDVWFYTQPGIFPYLYDFSLNAWLYYCPDSSNPGNYTSSPRWFYNFSTSQWTTNMAAQ